MKTARVKLAGKEYEIQPLPVRKARAFRERIMAEFDPVMQALSKAPTVEVSDMESISSLVDGMRNALVLSTDLGLEFLCSYAPAIQADRERIENEAFDDEVITAFVEVLKQLYPFGGVRNLMASG